MQFLTITKDNAAEHTKLIEQYKDLLARLFSERTASDVRFALGRGVVIFLLVGDKQKVLAGAMVCKDDRFLQNDTHLPIDNKNVCFAYALVADDTSPLHRSGLQLQKKIYEEFAAKKGPFAGMDIILADVVQKNLLSWHTAVTESRLHSVVRTDLYYGNEGKKAFFVAASADPDIKLVPQTHKGEALTGEAIIEHALALHKQARLTRSPVRGIEKDLGVGI